MQYLAAMLKEFLERHFTDALRRDSTASVRPVLIGPPTETLGILYDLLTANGASNWGMNGGEIVVLYVRSQGNARNTTSPSPILSRECQWDYAVTVRNSHSQVVILAAPSMWDGRPESLANTTETLGTLQTDRQGRKIKDPLWKFVIERIAETTAALEITCRNALQEITKQSQDLDPDMRNRVPWVVANELLSPPPAGLLPVDIIALASGLPPFGETNIDLNGAMRVIRRLGNFIGDQGLVSSFDKLRGTQVAQAGSFENDLSALETAIGSKVLSGAGFERAPAWFYRPGQPIPSWWMSLDAQVFSQILDEATDTRPARVELRCENALNGPAPIKGEPWITANLVNLRVSAPAGSIFAGPSFSRRIRTQQTTLSSDSNDATLCIDTNPPPHDRPMKYLVDAPGFASTPIDVLVLDSFRCGGLARVRDADQIRIPQFTRTQDTWRQEITLPRAGAIDLTIYHSQQVATVHVEGPTKQPLSKSTTPGRAQVTFVIEVEDDEEAMVVLEDNAGNSIGRWIIHFTVHEATEIARNRYEALVAVHQTPRGAGRPRTPRPQNRLIHRIEDACISSPNSWRPILACWSETALVIPTIDWDDPWLGDTRPQIDPRPNFTPPQVVLDAREAVRSYIQKQLRTIGEIDLGEMNFVPLVESYVQVYRDWLEAEPHHATWIDSLAVHAALYNAQAGRYIATTEPVALLLSPLHPLRLGWQCLAQQQLFNSLNRLCPAAGLLDPSSCPDISACYIFQGGNRQIRAFFSVACDNPYWSILWNQGFLGQRDERASVLVRLSELGLESRGITGGFSRSQAIDSLVEITKLLPGRATLRVGIIGSKESSSACADGVSDWCIDQYDKEVSLGISPFAVDVYDLRGASQPSPEQLALLSEKTQERVRWFKLDTVPTTSKQDLIILDQLSAEAPIGRDGTIRSPIGSGALCRVRIREDFQNAVWIRESRAANSAPSPVGLAGLLQETVTRFEELVPQETGTSQLQFQPNQQAIGSRLSQSTYLAVTSSQIDPACIIRGATEQQGYLWDYELPGVLGGDEDSAGYYLIAQPLPAMRRAIERSAAFVAPGAQVQDLLDEISRRGIPILKRLASGGSQSRGELGLLLAVRLLQDAFRSGSGTVRLPVWNGECIHLLLPVDPYEEPFERVRHRLCNDTTSAQRPDLLIFAIQAPANGSPIQLKITPVEVKFREASLSYSDQQSALQQAANLGQVLDTVWVQTPQSDLWATCGAALLTQCLNLAFRIYADAAIHGGTSPEWAQLQARVIQDVLSRTASITINSGGRLLVFDRASHASSMIVDVDGDGWQDTAILCRADAEVLLTGNGNLSQLGDDAVRLLDFSFPACGSQPAGNPPSAKTTPQTSPSQQPLAAPLVEQSSLFSLDLGINEVRAPSSLQSPDMERVEPITEVPPIKQGGSQEEATSAPLKSEGVKIIDEATRPLVDERRGGSTIPVEIRQQVRDAFEGFIGNAAGVRRITNDLLRALIDNPPHLSKNYLLTGQPSTGKTELARRLAAALRLPFVKLDGRGVGSRERLFELVNGELNQRGLRASQIGQQAGLPVIEYPPLIIFIDEVHLVPRTVQESLLTMLEAADRTVTLQNQVAQVNRTTFLFATTRASDVDSAFRSRCAEVQLREYNLEEVAQIVNYRFPHGWPTETYHLIARLGRLVPRVALDLARELETEMTVSEYPERNINEHLEEVRKAREIDEIGLTPTDIAYLDILNRADRQVGEQAIVNMLRTVDKDRIVDEVEPFLIRLGFIQLGKQGRVITDEGRSHLTHLRKKT
ncbi:Holliday junction DNA helicase RuvB C-terminal domain-containing protein [Candidatus Viridilinea mediisalina]|uniref:AAA+ ATPase domain-containing protein n=1 Tax=Candidatus Viridilinea mediisalina TaxID=2024553 RepID=A0A2A6RLD6_9CHLR|nr:Holliday junction DNA helicase RuvB C-terminal domain-containing protein [Candidatus Viridilinea mediisalina]PDW03753.1 hypothetical protein CJ255_07175 [Candidatus Viridilinea mediisalina]